jgi:PmbA protein
MVVLTLALRRFWLVAVLRQEELQNLAENAIRTALKRGADEAEAYAYQGLATSVGIERGQITRSSRIVDRGIGIRVIANKATGFSYTNILESENTIDEVTERALSSARASKPDADWRSLPSKRPYNPVKNTYDPKIVDLSSEDLVSMASLMLDATETADKRVFPIEGGTGASYLSVAVANSSGIASFDQGTVVECSMATVARDKGEVTPVCFEFNAERSGNIDPEWVGKEAARLAVSALKPKKTETKTTQVIFTQFAMQELLYYTLINAVKADCVQRGQSAFKGKIGSKVASEHVTICDDGLLDGGLRTHKFDGEGVPQQKTSIIEKGVLRSFIYDNYAAKKEGKESTGNSARAGYLSTPNVEATNFRIMPGSGSPEGLIGDVDDGLIVYYLQGAHSSNPASGDFSVVATPAWRIRKGELAHATHGVMAVGNIFQLLTNVTALADNERQLGQLVAPWILAENVKVIGK